MIKRFTFWNIGSLLVASTVEIAVGAPWSLAVLGMHALFVVGVVIGLCVVERA